MKTSKQTLNKSQLYNLYGENVSCNSNNVSCNSNNNISDDGTTLTLKKVNVEHLEIDAKEILMDLDMRRAEIILEHLSTEGLKRFIGHCDEIKALAEKLLLQEL